MTKPIIGISLDYEPEGDYSGTPWYAIRENYCTSVSDQQGIPVMIPHEKELINEYVDLIDGLILTGGGYDIPPTYYGSRRSHESITSSPKRTEFEFALTQAMLKTHKPILGICGGQELLTVALGGTLIQHIPDEIENAINHRQDPPYNQPCHNVAIQDGTLLHRIIKERHIQVNSDHHQATKDVPEDVVINAIADDGVVEGIEYPDHPFCLGVLWHPEHHASPSDALIFKAFIQAC